MKSPSRATELYRAWSKARVPFDKDAGRERFLSAQRAPRAGWREPAPRNRLAQGLVAAAVLLVAIAVWMRATAPISFTAGDRREVGGWLATDSNALPVVFSEGTRVELAPDSRGRVEEVSRAGAHVLLERGALHADVVHRAMTDWRFVAGPFEVRVTGTSLDVVWDPVTEHFEIGVSNGAVAVKGPYVGAEQVVRAGERCIVDLPARSMSLRSEAEAHLTRAAPKPSTPSAPAAPSGTPVASPEATSLQDTPMFEVEDSPAPSAPAPHRHAASAWTLLEARGDYAGAYDAVARTGLAQFYASAPPADLLRFAQVGKLSGHRDAHHDALTACRDRFAKSPQAALAAFELGRSAPPSEAIAWFEAYLREDPRGPLAREASGRLLEANALAGHDAAARKAAQEYLAKYPDGPAASMARRVLGTALGPSSE